MLKHSLYLIYMHKTTSSCRFAAQIHNLTLLYKKMQPNTQ